MRAIIGEVFRFAIVEGKATNDPTPALRSAIAAPTVTHRAAILDPKEFGAMLRAIDGYSGHAVTRACPQLQALLFPRPTMLNECGKFSVSGIESALAHADPDKVRAAYTRGSYWAERVEIAQWWADQCDEMKARG